MADLTALLAAADRQDREQWAWLFEEAQCAAARVEVHGVTSADEEDGYWAFVDAQRERAAIRASVERG